MIELKDFVDELKKNKEFADGFDEEYEKLKNIHKKPPSNESLSPSNGRLTRSNWGMTPF